MWACLLIPPPPPHTRQCLTGSLGLFGVTLGKPKVPREGTLEVAGGTLLQGGEPTIAVPASLVSCLLLSPHSQESSMLSKPLLKGTFPCFLKVTGTGEPWYVLRMSPSCPLTFVKALDLSGLSASYDKQGHGPVDYGFL